MIKRSIYILFIVLAGAAKVYAESIDVASLSGREIITADWEAEAERKIWDQHMRARLNSSAKTKSLNIKAVCSAEFIKEIETAKENLTESLEKSIADDNVTAYSQMCAELLSRYNSLSQTSEKEPQYKLIQKVKKTEIKIKPTTAYENSADANSSNKQKIAFMNCFFYINTQNNRNNSLKTIKSLSKKRDIKYTGSYLQNVNLSDYSTKTSKADYFRLVLYIYEDNPEAAIINSKQLFNRSKNLPASHANTSVFSSNSTTNLNKRTINTDKQNQTRLQGRGWINHLLKEKGKQDVCPGITHRMCFFMPEQNVNFLLRPGRPCAQQRPEGSLVAKGLSWPLTC